MLVLGLLSITLGCIARYPSTIMLALDHAGPGEPADSPMHVQAHLLYSFFQSRSRLGIKLAALLRLDPIPSQLGAELVRAMPALFRR